MEPVVYIPLIISGVSMMITLASVIRQSKKDKTDSAHLLYEELENLKNAYKERCDEIEQELNALVSAQARHEKEIKRLGKRVSYLRKGIDILIKQIRDAGMTPLWVPEDEEQI